MLIAIFCKYMRKCYVMVCRELVRVSIAKTNKYTIFFTTEITPKYSQKIDISILKLLSSLFEKNLIEL